MILYYGVSINLLIALPWILLYHVAYNAFLYDCWAMIPLGGAVGVAGVKVIHYNYKKMINLYSSKITTFQRNLNFHIHKTIKTFIDEHNEFCVIISDMNWVLGNMLLINTFTLIPVNLIWLHQFFFEDLKLITRVFVGFTSLVWMLQIFIGLLVGAFLSKQMHLVTKKLAQLQWRLNGWPFRLNNKIKLMTYFERLSSAKKLGASIGPLMTITYPVFHLVNNSYA